MERLVTHKSVVRGCARVALALGFVAATALSAQPAAALSLTGISDATLDSIAGTQIATLTSSFDFAPAVAGGDGTVTSSVFTGVGDAAGNNVYVYSIELFSNPPASISAVSGISFDFDSVPVNLTLGSGESFDAFYVTDDGGTVSPLLASHTGSTARFIFIPEIGNSETSHQFGLVSASLPELTVASVLDSGAGIVVQPVVYSNGGTAPIPEPHAAVLFAIGSVIVARFGLRRRFA
jgi:hypothetical protein